MEHNVMQAEKPRAPRYRVPGMSIIYDEGESYWTAPVVNASRSGLFLETSHQLALGTQLRVMPHGVEDERLPLEITGTVVRVDELDLDNRPDRVAGIAIRFDDVTAELVAQLDSYFEEHGVPLDPLPRSAAMGESERKLPAP